MIRSWISHFRFSISRATTARDFSIALYAIFFSLCLPGYAQESKVYRIGFISNSGRVEAFQLGLRDLGYIEGKNIVIEHRHAGTKLDQLPEMARDLVRLKVDVIFAMGTASIEAAKEATKSIPIVIASGDPMLSGLVSTLARPGENITGLTNFTQELAGKRLELLKEAVPQLSRVGVLWTHRSATSVLRLKDTEAAAQSLGLQVVTVPVQSPNDLAAASLVMKKERVGAFVMVRSFLIINLFDRIIDLAIKSQLPAMYDEAAIAKRGGLMSYGADMDDLDRRAANYVVKILKGAKPSDLPVEQPRKFQFVVNLKTAQRIGFTFPAEVLRWADEVIR